MGLRNPESRFGSRPADLWLLLSDTDNFLSRARLKPRFEKRVREWRRTLRENQADPETVRAIHSEIVAVRRALRSEGWELRLGTIDIALKGFRSDDSVAQGFARMVLIPDADRGFYYTVGDANHRVLDAELRQRLAAASVSRLLESHYLWYRVGNGVVELAGSGSESRDAYERLRTIIEERKSDLARTFRKLA